MTMRSSWNGALKVGLLVIPVKLYRATDDNEYELKQIHKADGAKIQYLRECTGCGKAIAYENVGRGKEVGDRVIPLTDQDMEKLAGFASKVVEVSDFIHYDEVDLTAFDHAYYIEPDGDAAVHVYTLLRQQLKASGRVGVATFSLRNKDGLAVLRARGPMLILQRMAWPDEVREPDFKFIGTDVVVTEQERELARQLIDTMSDAWHPEKYTSKYGAAFTALIQSKIEGTPPPEPPTPEKQAAMEDIGAVLRASIENARKKAEEGDAAA